MILNEKVSNIVYEKKMNQNWGEKGTSKTIISILRIYDQNTIVI